MDSPLHNTHPRGTCSRSELGLDQHSEPQTATQGSAGGEDAEEGQAASGGAMTGQSQTQETQGAQIDALPTRFVGTVMLSPDRPAKEMHQIVEAIVEQLTTLSGAEVTLKLEIDAEVSSGLDRAKVRTITENATTLGFIDKLIK